MKKYTIVALSLLSHSLIGMKQPFEFLEVPIQTEEVFANFPPLFKPTVRTRLPQDEIFDVSITSDGNWALTGSSDVNGFAILWNLNDTNNSIPKILQGHNAAVNKVSITPDGNRAVTGDVTGIIIFWDLTNKDTPIIIDRYEAHSDIIRHLSITPDGNYALTASDDDYAICWNLTNKLQISWRELHHEGWAMAASLTPDGNWALTGTSDGQLILRNLQNSPVSWSWRHDSINGSITSASLTPDSNWALAASGNTAILCDFTDKHLIKTEILQGHGLAVTSVALTPDGMWALTGSDDNTAILWDLVKRKAYMLRGHTGPVRSLFLTPDADWALTGSEDGTSILWNLTEKECITREILQGHSQPVSSGVLTSGANWALTGSFDGSAILWALFPPSKLFESSASVVATENDSETDAGKLRSDWAAEEAENIEPKRQKPDVSVSAF